jgi:membrane-associated phospholipid phosphatase
MPRMRRNGLRDFLRRRLSREEVVGLSFTISFLACVCLTLAIGLLAHEVREDKGMPDAFDLTVGTTLVGLRSDMLTRVMSAVTMLGDWRFLVVATPILLVALWRNGRHVSALLFAGSVLGGFGLSSVLKVALARARPDRWKALVVESTFSFPSGHAVMSTVFFGGLAAIVFHVSRDRTRRLAAVAGATIAVFSVAASRVYLGAHWATDTIAGVMVGLIWVLIYSAAVELTARSGSAPARSG